MIGLEEARAYVDAACALLDPVRLPLRAALGCVTAETVVSGEAVPPFANTAMDGFAVRAADTAGATGGSPARLRIVATLRAGEEPGTAVGAGEAVRIMTGAPIPPGADAVVMVERTTVVADGSEVEVAVEVTAGNHIRPAGDDIASGQEVFPPGTELTPAHLGVLASIGAETVAVHPRARVGVVSTGDELVSGGGALRPGQIRDSNRITLLGLVEQAGCEPVDLGWVRDDEAAITEVLERGVASCDALVTTGGVSMGDFDFVKVVLDRIGDMRWMQVAIKPAKPLAFGTVARAGDAASRRIPVFGLPGNPVSSMVSFELFARPFLRAAMGHGPAAANRPRLVAVADEELARRSDGKIHLVRVRCTWDGDDGRHHVRSTGAQGSHQLASTAGANALAVLPDGEGARPGDPVDVMLLAPAPPAAPAPRAPSTPPPPPEPAAPPAAPEPPGP